MENLCMNATRHGQADSSEAEVSSDASTQQLEAIRRYARLHLSPRRPATGFDAEGLRLLCRTGIFSSIHCQNTAIRTPAMLLRAACSGGADRGLIFAAGAHYFGCMVPLARHGSVQQQQQWLPSMQRGQRIGCLAITEFSGGAEQSALTTRMTVDSDGILLSGAKQYVTNALQASVALVIAAEFPQRGSLGLSALLVPLDLPGITVSALEVHGLVGAPAGTLTFENVRLPQSCRLGAPGAGLAVMLSALQAERTAILAGFLGAAEFDLSRCYQHLLARFCRGPKSGAQIPQVLRHRLSELSCQLIVADAILQRGLGQADAGNDVLLLPAIVKKTISETVVSVADEIHRIYAGLGWLNLNESASAVLDTRAVLAASGTTEVLLNLIWTQLPRTFVHVEDTPQ